MYLFLCSFFDAIKFLLPIKKKKKKKGSKLKALYDLPDRCKDVKVAVKIYLEIKDIPTFQL